MASTKEKKAELSMWMKALPGLHPWGDSYLIRRCGPVLSGVCLDGTRDPQAYQPTFFVHNLLVSQPAMTLAYGAPLLYRGVPRRLRYDGAPVDEDAQALLTQVPALSGLPTLGDLVAHVTLLRAGAFGPPALYPPHVMRDVLTIGAHLHKTDERAMQAWLDAAEAALQRAAPFNMHIIGSLAAWRARVWEGMLADGDQAVTRHAQAWKIPLEAVPAQVMTLDDGDVVTLIQRILP